MIGAELMARAVERQGVRTVFGLPGHLESFFGALQARDMRLIHMRHEAAVVIAADGYARARRGLGVACVTAGPGLANAVGGLATAFESCTPVLLFVGRNPLAMNDIAGLQDIDHLAIVRPITKWAQTVQHATRLAEYIDKACRIALTGRPGPVVLEIPRDIALHNVDEAMAEEWLGPLERAPAPHADPRSIKRAASLLSDAKRPLIVAGNGAFWGNSGRGLTRLAHEFGIPIMAHGLGRGLVPEDGEVSFSWPQAHPAARNADVVLVAGTRMGFAIGYAAAPLIKKGARFIQIDIDGGEIGRNHPVEVPVAGDCGAALEAIADELEKSNRRFDPSWVSSSLAERTAYLDALGREETGMVHPLRMARELAARMPKDAIFIADGANCHHYFKAVLSVYQAPGWMDHTPFGCMGIGLPFAIGATAAQQESQNPRPVFLGVGDGALGQYLGELATASLHGLAFFIMVANDGAWGASRNITLRLFNGTYGVDLNQSRYDLTAESLECHGELATCPAETGPAFDRALQAVADGTPALVNVLVDREAGAFRDDPRIETTTFNGEWVMGRARRLERRES